MKNFMKADVSEQQLEDIIRRNAGQIEEGLVFVDHQKSAAGGRLDVLLVDSDKSLVVAELKVTLEDGMLLQGLDYYDYVATNIDQFARLYKNHLIDPTKQVRLILIAPTFSQTLINRCKWFDLPISLFTYNCLKFEGEADVVPIFNEQVIPALPPIIEVPNLNDLLNYISDIAVRAKVGAFLDEIRNWKSGNIAIDPLKNALSMKVNGRVFAYLYPRRQHFLIGTYDATDDWKEYPIKTDDDFAAVQPIVKAAMEKRIK